MTEAVEIGGGRTTSFDKLVAREVKNPFDIEHIWAENDRTARSEFATTQEFQEWRNHVASLVLLPADVNRSLQDKPFLEKRPHYAKQNFYAASLAPSAYLHQPKFGQFMTVNVLPFETFEKFGKEEQLKRRKLVHALVEKIWSPERLRKVAYG